MFIWKRKSFEWTWSRVSIPSKTYNILAISNCSLIVKVIVVVKTLDNNQWPWNWFITQFVTIGFKHDVITFTIVHIWAFKTFCYKLIVFFLSLEVIMACLNSKVSSNIMTFNANLVLIKVLCFQGGKHGRRFALTVGCEELTWASMEVIPLNLLCFIKPFFKTKNFLTLSSMYK
jgi:hypothetical protein